MNEINKSDLLIITLQLVSVLVVSHMVSPVLAKCLGVTLLLVLAITFARCAQAKEKEVLRVFGSALSGAAMVLGLLLTMHLCISYPSDITKAILLCLASFSSMALSGLFVVERIKRREINKRISIMAEKV